MASFNKITIVGYLGRDPELRFLPDGSGVCNLSVATTEKRKDATGEPREITAWFRITVWGRQAEACNEYLSKGSQVFVEGRLSQQEYTDRDGNQRTSLEVRANDVQFLSTKANENEGHAPARSRSASASTRDGRTVTKDESRAALKAQASADFDDNEIPF
jgi:single-strand DNA-binding protein